MNAQPLMTVAHKVLEDWAMMLVDMPATSDEMELSDGDVIESSVVFNGPKRGKVSILAPTAFLAQLRENLLGGEDFEDDVINEVEHDAFREMANVLAGNFVTQAFGTETVYDLSSPSIKTISAGDLAELLANRETIILCADDTPIAITFEPERT